jgi:hypothetical protein
MATVESKLNLQDRSSDIAQQSMHMSELLYRRRSFKFESAESHAVTT